MQQSSGKLTHKRGLPGSAGFRSFLTGLEQISTLILNPTKFPAKHDVLFVASLSDITVPSDKGFLSQYLHPYVLATQSLDLSSIVILRPNTSGRFAKRTAYKITLFPRISNLRLMRKILGAIFYGKALLGGVESKLRGAIRSESPTWDKVLRAVSPKLVIGIGLSDDLCESARALSIQTIEVQHGFFTEMPKYWKQHLPDYFFCWDTPSAAKASVAGLNSVVAGHPFDTLVASRKSSIQDSSSVVCCVGLSWDEKGTVDSFGSFSPALLSAAKSLEASGVKLVLRLHPVMSSLSNLKVRRYLREIRNLLPQALIHNPYEVSLLDSIAASSFALTEASSIAFEFALLGKSTVVLNDKARESLSRAVKRRGLSENLIQDLNETSELTREIKQQHPKSASPDLRFLLAEILKL